jgi:hypothetical protein
VECQLLPSNDNKLPDKPDLKSRMISGFFAFRSTREDVTRKAWYKVYFFIPIFARIFLGSGERQERRQILMTIK